jgi:hypothetical protein
MSAERQDFRWFHVAWTTYGAWLPGDPRGFRTRDHRDHVDGDYKHPPEKGRYEGLHRASQAQQREPTVTLPREWRAQIAEMIAEKLLRLGAQFAAIAVAGRHVHLLVKLPRQLTRHWIGQVKRHVTFLLRDHGWSGKVWAEQAKYVPIRDRPHQLNAYRYILAHVEEGAAVMTWKEYQEGRGPGDAIAGL